MTFVAWFLCLVFGHSPQGWKLIRRGRVLKRCVHCGRMVEVRT